jgi:asparagine synthase (glutamine-hydrolysing)
MCGIAGIVSSSESNETGNLLKSMLQTIQHRGPDGAGFVIDGKLERKMRFNDLNLERKRGRIALGHVRLAITGEITGLQPFQSDNGKLTILHNGEIYNYRKLRSELEGDFRFTTDTDSEVILKLIEKYYAGDLLEAVTHILAQLDGVYALAVTDNKKTVIARDKIGVRQFYYCTNGHYTVFASEKKPLMAISHQETTFHRLLPGHLVVLNGVTVKDATFWDPASIRSTDQIEDKQEAIRAYGAALWESVRKRVAGRKRVGIIFSGGIDSFLIAYMVKKMGVPFTCYTAGCRGAVDIDWATRLSNRFDFPLQIKFLTLKDIEDLIPQVIQDIEDYSLNQVEVAIPIYASVRMAQEGGERVILTGQGADELFGGYPWYPTIVDREGYESFERYSWNDAFLLYKECLEREDKIAMAHSIELRVPFLDPEVIRVAFHISPKLKIDRGDDDLGKRIHREYSTSLGIPENIAFRKKEAAQHGANVHSAFEELANKTGVIEAMLEEAGYDPNLSVTEKLGSSSRYGFKYGDHHLWKPLSHVQYYLDSVAAGLNLLTAKAKHHWEETTGYLQSKRLIERNQL